MKEVDRKNRNKERLLQLYPTFRTRLEKVIQTLENHNLRPRIQDAWRSLEKQKEAFNKGHTKVLFGFHNVTGNDGAPEALAVDLLDDDAPLSPSKSYLLQLASAAQEEGLETGIRWGVPARLVRAIDQAIQSQNWDADVKIGWDPTHVQPRGITAAEAKGGKRPT